MKNKINYKQTQHSHATATAHPQIRNAKTTIRKTTWTDSHRTSRGKQPFEKEERKVVPIPPITGDNVRIVPLGGVEEVGRNMMVIETKDDIFIIDAGFQFVSEGDTPGVDYLLANTGYLEERKEKIRALIITHAHLDHIGGIPYIMDRIGNPPIYTRYLTSVMIQKRNEEFPHLEKLDIRILEPGKRIKIGHTYIDSFPVTHSIPDSMGIIIETKHGNIVLTGDLKLDHVDEVPTEEERKKSFL